MNMFLCIIPYLVSKNNTSGMFIRKIRQRPLEHHDKAIAESDQEKDVEEQPHHPREESGQLYFSHRYHTIGSPYCRQSAAIAIPECALIRFSCNLSGNDGSHVLPLLNRYWSEAWKRLASLEDRSIIANHKDIGMSRNA